MSDVVGRFRAARRDPGLVVVEGLHPLKHALRFGGEVLEALAGDRAAVLALARRLASDLSGRLEALVEEIEPDLFERLAPEPPHTGVIAIARRPMGGLESVLAAPGDAPVVLLAGAVHLSNIGAAVRAAAAGGAAGLLQLGPHDPWHPEAVRCGAGLQFAIPCARLEALPAMDRPLVAIHPDGEELLSGGIPPRAVLAFGSERHGLSQALLERADRRLRIPMRQGVSSLNLATAVAVAVYSWSLARG